MVSRSFYIYGGLTLLLYRTIILFWLSVINGIKSFYQWWLLLFKRVFRSWLILFQTIIMINRLHTSISATLIHSIWSIRISYTRWKWCLSASFHSIYYRSDLTCTASFILWYNLLFEFIILRYFDWVLPFFLITLWGLVKRW